MRRCSSTLASILAVLVVCSLTGCGTPSFLVTPVANTNKLQEVTLKQGKGGKIALIPVEGMLANAKEGGFLQPTENPLSLFTQQLERAERDPEVKAVVL